MNDKNYYLSKWGTNINDCDPMLKNYFCKNYESFFNLIPDDIKEIVCSLLEHYDYVSNKKFANYISEIYKTLLNIIKTNECRIIVLPIIDLYRSNSIGECNSSTCIHNYIYMSVIENNNQDIICTTQYDKINSIDERDVIVFVDDFSGTGCTIIDMLESIKKRIADKKVKIITMISMKEAKNIIQDYISKNKLNIEFIALQEYDKGFNITYESTEAVRNNKEIFKKKCESLNIKNDIFGFRDSEALISFYLNTPNNTIKIFWELKDGNDNFSLFGRHFKIRYLDQIKNNKNIRKEYNYERKQYN